MKKLMNVALVLLVILTLAACGGSARQGGSNGPQGTLQATAGFHQFRDNQPVAMYFFFRLDLAGDVETADVSVTGPAGWNSNEPRALGSFGAGVHEVHQGIAPRDGTYTVTANIAGVEHTATAVVDTSQRLPLYTGLTAVAEQHGIVVEWDPVPGAVTYRVQFNDPSREIRVSLPETAETAVVLPVAFSALDPALMSQYTVAVFGSTHDSNGTVHDFSNQYVKAAEQVPLQLPQ